MELRGNTVLITGGTSGIGHALAARLLERGNTVLITGRTEERLAAARHGLAGVHAFVCDQSDPAAIARLAARATGAFPKLNVLINNAGIGLKRNLNDTSKPLEDLEREIRSNLSGPVQLVQALLPQLKGQGDAMIVNVTSGLAFLPLGLKPIYCATKAAMHAYTQCLRVQLSLTNVRVVELAPPAVKTKFNRGQEEMNIRGAMDVGKLADAAIRGLERGDDEILPGATPILRLIGRLNPRAVLARAAAAQMRVQA